MGITGEAFNFVSWMYPGIYYPGQGIWSKMEKSSKVGQDEKSLISTFACFLSATAEV